MNEIDIFDNVVDAVSVAGVDVVQSDEAAGVTLIAFNGKLKF